MLHDVELRQAVIGDHEAHPGTDVLVVLVSALEVLHVGSQVGVDDTEGGVVEHEPDGHTTLVALGTGGTSGVGAGGR